MTWSGPAPGCCWRRRYWPPPAAAWRRWSRCSTRPSARPQARPRSRSSPLPAGRRSLLVNVPALIALQRSYLAQLRGDAEATAAFASRALAELGEGEWMLRSIAQGFLAVAEWLRGRLAEAERAFVSSIAGWRAAGQPTLTAWGCYHLGQVQRAQGRLDAAAGPTSRCWRSPLRPAAAAARRRPGVCGPGRGGLPAERARHRAAACHRGHRAVPPVRLHPAAGRRPGYPGVDPAGHRRSGRRAGGDGRGRAGRAGPGRRCSTPSRAAGAAAAGPGRPRRSRPLRAGAGPRPPATSRIIPQRARAAAPGPGAAAAQASPNGRIIGVAGRIDALVLHEADGLVQVAPEPAAAARAARERD